MARAGGDRVRSLFTRAENAGSLSAVIFNGIGAVFLGIGSALASGVLTLADLIIIPASALANAAGTNVDAIFGGFARIVDIGAITAASSIAPGGTFALGPFTFALAIGAGLLGLYILIAYLSEGSTSNFVPGVGFDIPTPGFAGTEEDSEDA